MGLKSRVLTVGSCFSDAMGDRLTANKVNVMVNPFGVIYNPESIHTALRYSIFNEPVPEHTYLHHQEVFANYNFHSAFSSLKKEELVARLANTVGSTHYFLKDTEWLLLTYGTAWVYQRNDTGEIVANCHKVPGGMFSKMLLETESITSSFKSFFQQLKKFNRSIKVILTISPVRHIKDSLELNSVSKAILRVACHHIASELDDVEYFPAYELMMDDLRDYRFYASDLLHPTADAEEYIWEKFMERYFSTELKEFVKKWKLIQNAMKHRPFHSEASAHQQFLQETLKQLNELRSVADVEAEILAIRKQIL